MTTVVKDKLQTLSKAQEITQKLMKIIVGEIQKSELEDDPAEQIYLSLHIVGSFAERVCVILNGFGKTYDIPNLNIQEIRDWIVKILDEYLKLRGNKN